MYLETKRFRKFIVNIILSFHENDCAFVDNSCYLAIPRNKLLTGPKSKPFEKARVPKSDTRFRIFIVSLRALVMLTTLSAIF